MNKLKLLVSSALIALDFSVPSKILGMDHLDQIDHQNVKRIVEEHLTQNPNFLTISRDIESEKSVQARRAETLAIRGPMIDECINQYKILTRKDLTYRELADAFLKLSPLYNARQNANKEKNKEDVRCDLILEKNWFIQPAGLKWGREMTSPHLFITDPSDDGATVPHLNFCLKQIKEDLLENMRLYKDLHGEPHPRFDEFSYLALTSNDKNNEFTIR